MTVATQYWAVDVTVPPGTPETDPLVTSVELGDVFLRQVQLQIPAGHMGFTGYAVVFNGVFLLPWSQVPAWIIGDNFYDDFSINTEVDQNLTIWAYNTDVFPHTFYSRFVNTPISLAVTATPTSQVPVF